MARERDCRTEIQTQPATSHFSASAEKTLDKKAEEVSRELPGEHQVVVQGMDPVTRSASAVVSHGAEPQEGDLVDAALSYVHAIKPVLGLTAREPVDFRPDPAVLETSAGAAAVHLQQTLHDIAIFQAGQTVRFNREKAIEASSGRPSDPIGASSPEPDLTATDALAAAAKHLARTDDGDVATDQFGQRIEEESVDLNDLKPSVESSAEDAERHTLLAAPPLQDPVSASLIWFDLEDSLRLSWEVLVGLPEDGDKYRVIVDAHDGSILYCHRLTAHVVAQGDVFMPDGGAVRERLDFPLDPSTYQIPFSQDFPVPFPRADWVESDQTEGNNVRAHLNSGGTTAGSTIDGTMIFEPNGMSDDDQLRVNLFFFCNFMHDFLYLLGFREADGNFQNDNSGLGGDAQDRVDAFVHPQQVQGTANMYTPADGTAPIMNMGLVVDSKRHTALDSSVVFHEYTHGLTNRLVGGGIDDRALDAVQAGSMGEGWGDYVACTINDTDVVGTWVVDNQAGIREYPYDEEFPDDFGMLGTGRYTEVHNNGEIWCAALMELNRKIGSALAIQLVVDGLKLTPANPTYLQARDAILAALESKADAEDWSQTDRDSVRQGAWQAFAKFGMGHQAQSGPSTGYTGIVADFSTP